jgi:hypothetical protein
MIRIFAIVGIAFGIVVLLNRLTVDRLPRWLQWIGSLAMGAGMVALALLNSPS